MLDQIKQDEKNQKSNSYQRRISNLSKLQSKETKHIEAAIDEIMNRLKEKEKSFIVYGEPQSGKTELMLALACKLFDENFETIFVIMNDNVSLEDQNYDRFVDCGELEASPIRFQELKEDGLALIPGQKNVIFCRKNGNNLREILERSRKLKKRVVLDDEADFASPDININKPEYNPSTINDLISKLIKSEDGGIYIGVTATPGRCDLNNTFQNNAKKWVFVDPYPNYIGRKDFFDNNTKNQKFNLKTISSHHDNPKNLENAIYRFLVKNAYLNIKNGKEDHPEAYSMLIHNSGKKDDHSEERKIVQRIVNKLKKDGEDDKIFESLRKTCCNILTEEERNKVKELEILRFIYKNKDKTKVLIINSKKENLGHSKIAANPKMQFTFALGGNIISRGLTFNNLLSFYFTRTVKGKYVHNTYIQRARMFGDRSKYLEHFELCVDKELLGWWKDCFKRHEMSLAHTKAQHPIWFESKRTKAADSRSINKDCTVNEQGEMKWDKFKLNDEIVRTLKDLTKSPIERINYLLENELIQEVNFPRFMLKILKQNETNNIMMVLPKDEIRTIHTLKDANYDEITRDRGGLIQATVNAISQYDNAQDLIMPIKNDKNQCRFYYKSMEEYKIIRNTKHF